MWTLVDHDWQILGKEHYGGSAQTVVGASVVDGDAPLEVDGSSSFVRAGPHSGHGNGSVEPDDLPGIDQTEPVVSTPVFDGVPLLAGQILASVIALALSSPDLGKDGPVMVDISDFTAANILDKRSSPVWSRIQMRARAVVGCRLGGKSIMSLSLSLW
jgi:hypothetical protein